VIGRIVGQMIGIIYTLLKKDAEVLQACSASQASSPTLYDPLLHQSHGEGQYRSQKPQQHRSPLILHSTPSLVMKIWAIKHMFLAKKTQKPPIS
jgi:hypothetical protein